MIEKQVLSDLGEREIVKMLLPRFVPDVGDDCAYVKVGDRMIAVTSDPVPTPAAMLIGGDPDLYWMGRLLVTINASDLAAAGATPLAFVAAIDAPSDLGVSDFTRLLEGIADGCGIEGLTYSGGNLRESSTLTCVGTAIGLAHTPIRRKGAEAGDRLVSIGAGGLFWRDVMAFRAGRFSAAKEQSSLFAPHSQIKPMQCLVQEGLVKAAIDNSDGLLPSLQLLSSANGLSIEVDVSRLRVSGSDALQNVDPVRLWLGWGDWNVIVAVHPVNMPKVLEVAAAHGSIAVDIGYFCGDGEAVLLRRAKRVAIAPRLESERFVKDSWFTQGIERYVDLLLSVPIP